LFYAEQPYSSRPRYIADYLGGRTPSALRDILGEKVEWLTVKLDKASRVAKRDAMDCYDGELAMFGSRAHLDNFVAGVLRRERVGLRAGDRPPAFLGGVLCRSPSRCSSARRSVRVWDPSRGPAGPYVVRPSCARRSATTTRARTPRCVIWLSN